MIYKKTELGLLIGFVGVTLAMFVLALFVPTSTIFLALVLGLLFALPVSALVLILMSGAFTLSKKLRKPLKPEKEAVVIPTN